MKAMFLCFSVILLIGLTVFFANLQPAELQPPRVEAAHAPKKTQTVHKPSTAKKPVKPHPAVARRIVKPKPVLTTHQSLMQAAGISQADWPAAEKMVMIESSWNVLAVEPTTGACGLAQELPCGKAGCGTPTAAVQVCELEWADRYVASRYGGWWPALDFHYANGWY